MYTSSLRPVSFSFRFRLLCMLVTNSRLFKNAYRMLILLVNFFRGQSCLFFCCRKLFSHLTAAPCLCNLSTDFIVDQCNVSHYSAWPHFSTNVFRLYANSSDGLFCAHINDVSVCLLSTVCRSSGTCLSKWFTNPYKIAVGDFQRMISMIW